MKVFLMRKTENPCSRRHVLIDDDVWDFLTRSYGPGGLKPIGVSLAIRTILRAKVRQLRAEYERVDDSAPQAQQHETEPTK